MATGEEIGRLGERLRASIGAPVYEDVTGLARAPEPRETWIDLQGEVVALAARADPDGRRALALALLEAILEQPSFGPANRLSAEAFSLVLEAAPGELAAALERSAGHQYGGQRYLRWHVWSIPGAEGARWLGVLARADDVAANFLLQDMAAGRVPRWPEEDWPARLDSIAELPPEPRPGIVTVLFTVRPPAAALPALVRVAMAHGADERDHLVRGTAGRIRDERRSGADAVELFDWEARRSRPELFRRLLELSGDAGERRPLVAAAVEAGYVPADEAEWLAGPLERPAWADGDVPWQIEETVVAGELRLPAGRLAGGDPWWTGNLEGFPWDVAVPAGSYPVSVVVAAHPLGGRQCAALELVLDPDASADGWSLVVTKFGEEGYHVEAGVASFGAPAVYDAGAIHDQLEPAEFFHRPPPAWDTVDGGAGGTIVLCTVGPQHQLCRTWLGTAGGRPVAVVTDLGLLGLDLARDPARPWLSPS